MPTIIYVPRSCGSTLILNIGILPVPTLVVVAMFRDGIVAATHRDGIVAATHRDGIVTAGGR